MRLRYLHLPRCGPLTDTSIVFGREDLITKTLNLPRRGSLNFLVGVNGSGKSSILRALYRTFRSLSRRELPALPVTLAWDRTLGGGETGTAFLHYSNRKDATSFFATCKPVPGSARRQDWEEITAALTRGEPHSMVEWVEPAAMGPGFETSSQLFARLPKRLIAYTSGAVDPWEQLDHPVFGGGLQEEGQHQPEDERPAGWCIEREWDEEQPVRLSNLLTRYALKASGTVQTLPGAGQVGELSSETVERLRQELGPLDAIRQKVLMNQASRTGGEGDAYFRIQPQHLRFAGITLGLWQAAKELAGQTEEGRQEALRSAFLQQRASDGQAKDARRVLNEIDWFWPTHLSLTYRDADDRVSPQQHRELLCLIALADEVISQPLGRQRAVLSLGPSDGISLSEKLKEAFPFGIPSKAVEQIAERVEGCKTGAEAFLRILSADQDLDSTPMDVFTRLRDWERTGLLEEITLTVKRLHRPEPADGEEPDDTLVTYDQLSDGEQMLLGRMGLLFLLRGQDGSLLLLDEPETHFNDVWKREIVEMVDLGLLNSTDANVLIATHTSIALTDAFAAEVTVLDKTDAGVTARGVSGGLFGTDPGEVTMNLFRADSSTGSRAVDLLDRLLKTDWKGREAELEAVLDVLGSSFHRAELRAVLKQLQKDNDGAAPG
ncbi:MAG: AAA family ATPase [Deltaproteobacteria bacterium]|nr:AAA family ATPase [Deltaproteobacteria bacterium]